METESNEKSGGDSPRGAADSNRRQRSRWVRALVRTLKATGMLLLLFVAYTIWFIRGTANPTIDYLPQLNALHSPSNQAEDNAWPYYEKAMGLVVEPNETLQQAPWFRSMEPSDEALTSRSRMVLENWVAVNSPAWQQFELAAARRQCRRVYRNAPGEPLIANHYDDPPLRNWMHLARLGLWKSRLAAEEGRIDESLGYCLTVLRAGAHCQRTALVVEQLIGRPVSAMACREILHLLTASELSFSELTNLQARITSPYADGYPLADFEGERLVMLDTVQRVFTSGGLGGGHYLVGAYSKLEVSDPPVSWWRKAIVTCLDVGASAVHARRNRTIAKANEWYDRMSEIARLSPYERRERRILCMSESMGWVERLRYRLVRLLTPAERRVSELAFRARVEYEALVTVVAVKRYRLEKGSYPPDLEAVVHEGYLDKLPMDPYSDRALVYRLTDEGFALYSVGPDFTGDGGTPGRDLEDRPELWGDQGDAVFWPVRP